MQRNFQKRC